MALGSSSLAPRALGSLRRRVLLHRRGLAALLVAAAVLLGLQAVAAPPPATTSVWSAARDLTAGAVLGPGDLVPIALTDDALPTGALAVTSDPTGRLLASPVRAGETLTDVRLLGEWLLEAMPGLVATPVRLGDAAVLDLLAVGDAVDVVATDPAGTTEPEVLVTDARVLVVPRPSRRAEAAGTPGGLVVLGVPEDDAARVSSAAVSRYLSVLLRR